jgi:hypothetical protein
MRRRLALSPRARAGLTGLAIVAALVIPVWVRAGIEARALLQDAAAVRSFDPDREVELLGRAARWRAPGLPWADTARGLLWERGREARARGEDGRPLALRAFREVRRSLLATRAFGVPHPEELRAANLEIAQLMAEQEADFGTDVGGRGDPAAYHLALLEQLPGPVPWRANLAAFLFLAWVVTVGGFVVRALDGEGRLRPRSALGWGLAALLLLVGWMVAWRFADGS